MENETGGAIREAAFENQSLLIWDIIRSALQRLFNYLKLRLSLLY